MSNISNSLFGKGKALVFGIIALFLLTSSLSPVYAGLAFGESKAMKSKTVETTMVDIRNPLEQVSFLDKYDSSEIEERHHKHSYFNRHDRKNPIREPTVNDGEEWNIVVPDDYPKIQEAINHADQGCRILVRAGIYRENVEIDVDSLTLHGEDKETTIIDGREDENVIMIFSYADGLNISGFTIRNSGDDHAGINISSHYNIIQDNILTDNGDGIQLYLSSGNQIQDNQIENNNGNGVWLHRSNGNTISNNVVENNGENGIEFTYSSLGTILDNNEISDHVENGVYLDESSLGNMFTRCTIKENNYGVLCTGVSDGNIFHHNAFIQNNLHAFDNSLDRWDYNGLGNFWDDYIGEDKNGDSIGDTPYVISGGNNIDRYPLMNPLMMYKDFDGNLINSAKFNAEYTKVSTGSPSNNDGSWDITVPDDYSSIQEAVDHANPGDRIFVRSGIYYETLNITIPGLTIHGEDKETTVIDGGGNGHVVFVHSIADVLNISGFTIQSSGKHFTGLYLYSDSSCVEDIIFKNCNIGLALRDSDDNVVKDCEFEGNNYGIWTWMCTNSTLEDNVIENNSLDGIAFQWSRNVLIVGNTMSDQAFNGILEISCSELDLQHNSIHDNIEFGIQIFSSNDNKIKKNSIENNTRDGISFHKSNKNVLTNNIVTNNSVYGVSFRFLSSDNNIKGNNIGNNWYGIRLYSSSDNDINGNNISNNRNHGIGLDYSSDNTISGNIITGNEGDGGILLGYSYVNTITGNTITDNGRGMWLVSSSDNAITDNVFQSNGITIAGDSIDHWTSHTIENNIANGKPIRYYKNIANIQVPTDSAQVILANCTNFRIQNLNLSNVNMGVQLGFSSDNMISGNNITDNDVGIVLYYSSDNIISGNNIGNNDVGIGLYYSSDNIISGNNIGNSWCGIFMVSCLGNKIEQNNFLKNDMPVISIISLNKWDKNYWDSWIGLKYMWLRFLPYYISLFNFDWNPAKEPYDIGG